MEPKRRGRPPKVIYETPRPVEKDWLVAVEIINGNPWYEGRKLEIGVVLAIPEALAKHLMEHNLAQPR